MRLHHVLALFLWLSGAVSALAQNAGNLPVVGVLRVNTADTVEPMASKLRAALAALGQIDGRTIRIETRLAEGHVERLPELARSLVAEKASVIITAGDPPTRAAQHATQTIPIVALVDDLVAAGLINSLAKPGGNTTGVSILATELDAKKIELLKQILPSARRFGVLRDPANSVSARMKAIAETAQALGVELHFADVSKPDDIGPAFASFSEARVEAVDVLASPLLFSIRTEIGRLSFAHKLPAICQFRENVEAGCVASYGISLPHAYVVVAELTDKMLKGSRPEETPAQQPSTFELVLNQKAARAIGIAIPPALLARANEFIK